MNISNYTRQQAFKALGACTQERLIRELKSSDPEVVEAAKANFNALKASGITGRSSVEVVMHRRDLRFLDRKTLGPRHAKPKSHPTSRPLAEAELQPARETFGSHVESGVSLGEPAHTERPRSQRGAKGKRGRKATAGKS